MAFWSSSSAFLVSATSSFGTLLSFYYSMCYVMVWYVISLLIY